MAKENGLYKKPNGLVYGILKLGAFVMNTFFYNLKITRNDLKGVKPARRVILCNHESAIDFFSIYQATRGKVSSVISNSFLNSLKIKPFIDLAGCIGKNQFQTTVSDMRKMKAVLDNDATLVFYPAGLMSESGINTPIPRATGKTIKWFDADVYVAKVSGTYLTSPKWSKIRRKGKTTLEIYKLYDREQLKTLDDDFVYEDVCKRLSFDAYRNNERDMVKFRNGDNVVGLDYVLYKCPNCNKEEIRVLGTSTLACLDCGYAVTSDCYGLLSQTGEVPIKFRYPSDWHAYIEESVYNEIKSAENFSISTRADIYKINDKKHCFEKVGDGVVSLDSENFTIDGTLFGEPFYKKIYSGAFPILPFKPGRSFEIQDGKDIYRIHPENPYDVQKWIFSLKALHKLSQENN